MTPPIFPRMKIDLTKISQNGVAVTQVAGAHISQLVAVVKDNGYGLGSFEVANELSQIGVKTFGVATIEEALFLREKKIEGTILLLGSIQECKLLEAVKNNITLSIVDVTLLKTVTNFSEKEKLSLHILLDTGMHRSGLTKLNLESLEVCEELKSISSNITGVYTHYHSADGDDLSKTAAQNEDFEQLLNRLSQIGVSPKTTHSANSAGSLRLGIGERELIRTGIAIYGGRSDPEISFSPQISSVATIEAKISSIRKIKKGDGVSYGHIWSAKSNCSVATVAIGYGDGFPRIATGKCEVIIKGKRLPVVGRVTMDSIMVKLPENFDVLVGEIVTIIGKNGEQEITADELAITAQTISYELFCNFGALISREYYRDGKLISFSPKIIY